MSDPLDSVTEKVLAIFRELAGERAQQLDGTDVAAAAIDAMTRALSSESDYEISRAADVAFHLCDWNSDAAFIVAVLLFPERFTPQEIEAGVGLFLCHAPNHIREACRLTGQYVWESFPEADEVTLDIDPQTYSLAVARIPGKGRGVVAVQKLSAGDLIERPSVIVISREDLSLVRRTQLAHYYFEWGEDCQQAAIAARLRIALQPLVHTQRPLCTSGKPGVLGVCCTARY